MLDFLTHGRGWEQVRCFPSLLKYLPAFALMYENACPQR